MVRTGLVLASVAMTLAGCSSGEVAGGSRDSPSGAQPSSASAEPSPSASATAPRKPLAGRVVVLDPGHQLGNARFRAQVGREVDAGGFAKACNTTGTASDDGYPEATFAWEVAVEVRRLLRRAGARVLMTRDDNSREHWGPCIDERGRIGNPGRPGPTADVRVSIHGDGVLDSSAHGFHVIRPGRREGWTDDIAGPSERLALAVRDALVGAGFAPSTYRGEDGVDVRADLGTLNHSDVPAVMAELGNMRAPRDAAAMTSAAGRARYAAALAAALRAYLSTP